MKNRPFPARLSAAWNGIRSSWQSEKSFRTQSILALGAAALLIAFRPEPMWWAVFALTIGGVLALELFNTALEHIVDRLHPESDPRIGLAKDCASGGVLVFSLISLVVLGSFLYHVISAHTAK